LGILIAGGINLFDLCPASNFGDANRASAAIGTQGATAKIALLESVVWDILVDRFNSTPNPVSTARQYAETKLPSRHGVKTAPDLEPTREAVWQEFFDSVIAGVRMSEERA